MNNANLQKVTISKIRVNATNPRKFIAPGAIEAKAASMKEIGLETPIKVRLLTTEEKQTDSNHDFELIGGQLRLAAAKTLGWDTIDALVLDVTPAQADLAALMDNRNEDMHWLDWYQAIERQSQALPKPTQQQLADQLGVSQVTVSRAIQTLKWLNQGSRDQIYSAGIKPGGDTDGGKRVALALTALEDAEKVETALKVALDRKMTEAQAKGLVKWVVAGNTPETYSHALKIPKVKSEKVQITEAPLPSAVPDQHVGSKSYVIQGIKNAASLFRDQFITGMGKYMARALAGAAWVLGFCIMAMIVERIWFSPSTYVQIPEITSTPAQPTQVIGTSVPTVSASTTVANEANPSSPKPQVEGNALSVPISGKQEIGIGSPTPVATIQNEVKAVGTPAEKEEDLGKSKVVIAKHASAKTRVAAVQTPTVQPTPKKSGDDVADEVVKKVVPDVADELVKKLF